MSVVLDINNFTREPSPGDRLIYIYEPNGKVVVQIDPYSSTFFSKGSNVYIMSDGVTDYNNMLLFGSTGDATSAIGILNDIKKEFIDTLNNCNTLSHIYIPLSGSSWIYGDLIPSSGTSISLGSSSYPWKDIYLSGSTIYLDNKPLGLVNNKLNYNGLDVILTDIFDIHTGSTTYHIDQDLSDALYSQGANIGNPFVTLDDIATFSGDTKRVLVSSTDIDEGFLIEKITGSTNISIVHLNVGGNESLRLDVDLTDYYTITEVDNNFLSGSTTITDLSGYTTSEIDTLVNNGNSNFDTHTGDTTIHFIKSDINLDNLGDVNVSGVTQGQYLSYSGGTWIAINDSTDLSNYYTKSEVYNTGETYTITQVDTLLDTKIDLILFNSHTGATNPHGTGFFDLTVTAHTHTNYALVSHNHNNLYYTKIELLPTNQTQGASVLDNRYFTQTWIENHYYDKDDVYTKTEVDDLIENIIYSGSTGSTGLYYTKSESNAYFLSTGTTIGDLDGYTTTQVDTLLGNCLSISGGTLYGDLTLVNLIPTSPNSDGEWVLNMSSGGTVKQGKQFSNKVIINNSGYIDTFPKGTDYSAFWYYTVRQGVTNIRTGIIYACWDDTGTAIEYASNSTMDIGNTDDITFDVNMDPGFNNVRLFANCTGTWEVKITRLFI